MPNRRQNYREKNSLRWLRRLTRTVARAPERTVNGLQRRVGSLIRGLKPSEGAGYFRNAGYDPL
jgi:hypothetical protein